MRFLIATLAAFFLCLPARAEPIICIETELLANAYHLVNPTQDQYRIPHEDVEDFMRLFNSFPPETDYEGDDIIVQDVGHPRLIVILISSGGEVCTWGRVAIPHEALGNILNQIEQGRS